MQHFTVTFWYDWNIYEVINGVPESNLRHTNVNLAIYNLISALNNETNKQKLYGIIIFQRHNSI